MKCSFDISNFLEEISSLSYSIVFLYFFALITEEGFLWNFAFKLIYLCFSPLLFASLLFSAVCKASSENHFALLHFLNLSKFWEIVEDRGTWHDAVHGVAKNRRGLSY